MKILYIYRNQGLGFSIGKVFKPIEQEMRTYGEVDSVELPCANYSLKSLWKNIKAARKSAKRKEYDIIHITGSEHYLIPFLSKGKVIVTVHDLGFHTNSKFSINKTIKYFLFIFTLKFAKYVTFISEKSASEADKLVHLKKDKCRTIYNPVGPEFTPHPKRLNTERPIILHIGTKSNKNLKATSFALNGLPCKLRIIGSLSDNQRQVLEMNKIDFEQASNLTDDEILQEYINCDYVNFPSLYEGFGMPIIEGNAIGRPVITSNIPPMINIANGAAIIVDPTKPESIRLGYEKVRNCASKIISKGFENVKRFSVKEITKQYFYVYSSLTK